MKEAEEAKEVEKKNAKEVSKQPTIKETLERGTKVDQKGDLQNSVFSGYLVILLNQMMYSWKTFGFGVLK